MRRRDIIITGVMAMLAAGLPCSLQAQDNNNNYGPGKPSVHISVHKQVDKNGNIISYDSVYSYSYSGSSPDTAMMNSMYNNGPVPGFFNSMPGFTNDPFMQDYGQNMDDMQKMMDKEMQRMMQNAGMPTMGNFFQAPPQTPSSPKTTHKTGKKQVKKKTTVHNVVSGGAQI